MESGNEELASSMQKIASKLLSVEVASGSINKQEAIQSNFEETRDDTGPGDFEDLRNFQEARDDTGPSD